MILTLTQLIFFRKLLTAVKLDPNYLSLDLVLEYAFHHLTLHIHLNAGKHFLLTKKYRIVLCIHAQVCTLANL